MLECLISLTFMISVFAIGLKNFGKSHCQAQVNLQKSIFLVQSRGHQKPQRFQNLRGCLSYLKFKNHGKRIQGNLRVGLLKVNENFTLEHWK